MNTIRRRARFFWQKLGRGFSDYDTWNLDMSLAKIILPRLKRFKELNNGHPIELSEKEWHVALDKMIAAFEFSCSDKWEAEVEDFEKHQEGLNLFAKYFWSLWW